MNDDFQPATPRQKISLVCGLILVSVLGLGLGAWVLERVEEPMGREIWVSWQASENIVIKAESPVSFWYDHEKHRLVHRGPIDSKAKAVLQTLLEGDPSLPIAAGTSSSVPEEVERSYRQAIDHLAFLSNQQTETELILLLLLGGMGGFVGVQLRSVSNFIGVACVRNKLDFRRWWPWYVLRPLLGFLVGVLVVVITKSELYSPERSEGKTNLWWLGLAVLAGFGAEDFGLRLRLVSHTLFGVSELKAAGQKTEEDRADENSGKLPDAGGEPTGQVVAKTVGEPPSGKEEEVSPGGFERSPL